MSFKNQVVFITGASSGIGWELAKQLAGKGARVGLVARRREKLSELASLIIDNGGAAATAPADVGRRQEVLTAARQLTAELGPADTLVAGAGITFDTLADHSDVDRFEQMVRVNLLGVVYAVEAVLPEMLQRKKGHLAAISSLSSYRGLPGKAGYCATKAAVNSYLEGLRVQLRTLGVAVTTICPGFVDTPATAGNNAPKPWLMSSEDAAKRIIRGLERKVKTLNFPWQTTWLMRLARWAPDRILARQSQNIYPASGEQR